MIDSEAIKAWLTYPTTQAVLKELRSERDAVTDAITNGSAMDLNSAEATGLRTTFLLGRLKGLNSILNMTIDEEI